MTIDKQALSDMLLSAADLLQSHMAFLSEIDSRFGDGDHGVTIGKIAAAIRAAVTQWGGESIKEFLDGLGMAVMCVNGGSAGPLYGTLLSGLSVSLSGTETSLDAQMLKAMLHGCLAEMEEITAARIGDKTMMDALIPAVQAAEHAPDEIAAVLRAAADAAAAGAKASENFVSKFGRARSYKEQTVGTPDAGALSTSLLFQGLCQGFKQTL